MSGAGKGPQAIITASEQLELYDFADKTDFSGVPIHTVSVPSHLRRYEDVETIVQATFAQIEPASQFYLGIGGDHCVTVPAIEALSKFYGDFGVVQIDAHADLRDTYEGNKRSHACIMRRVTEVIGADKILQIGIRAVCEEEATFIADNKVMHLPGNRGLEEDLLPELNEPLARLPEHVFLTIDLDGLDPTIMPDVGTPVPGGLSWQQTISIVRRVFERKAVIGADVVEIASGPGTERSDFAASLLCQKIMTQYIKNLN